MDFELSDEHQRLQDSAVAFARSLQQADIRDRDRDGRFSADLWKRLAQFGVLAMPVPEEQGGLGLGLTALIAVMEGLGYGIEDHGLLFSMNAHLWTASIPILLYGTDEQRRKYLPGLCSGELIAANAATEPDAGSDVFSMRTVAKREDENYVLNGAKTFVTNAPIADLIVAYATIDRSLGAMGVTAFLVERDRAGLSLGAGLEKMGLRTSPMAELWFEDCRVPVSARLGREGRGVEVFECSMTWERGCILACYLGLMRRRLERCIEHARTRQQFGQPIGKFQSVANRIVDMKVRLETCRPLVYRVGWLLDHEQPAVLEAAIAKLHVSECLVQSSLDALQLFGGYGYMTEYQVERELRDAIGSRIYSGTSEIQRNIIARQLGI